MSAESTATASTERELTQDTEAAITRKRDGSAFGVGLFVTAESLRELGIDTETTDRVRFVVSDGDLSIEPAL